MTCWPKILVWDCGLASTLFLRMLTLCEESGLWPIHVCMGTTVPMNMSSSGIWLRPLVGRGFKPRRGQIHCVQTMYCPDSGGYYSHVVIQQWCYPTKFTAGAQPGDISVQGMAWTSGEWGKPQSTPKNLSSSPRRGKHHHTTITMFPSRRRNVLYSWAPKPGGTKFIFDYIFNLINQVFSFNVLKI